MLMETTPTSLETRTAGPPLRGRMKTGELMAAHTSWKVGGPADRFYVPADEDDLARFLAALPADEPVTWIGLGSNVLVRDGGIRGTVISSTGMKSTLELLPGNALRAGCGVPCAKVARFSARRGLAGAEFLAGIPGTVGGALAMNAGAFGAETWSIVSEVETVTRKGRRLARSGADFATGYRRVDLAPGEWFLNAVFRLAQDAQGHAPARIRELLARRAETQPTGRFSCGSVFRNPPGDFAGRLVEQCGLKGHAVGAACVSEKHANFIINRGKASAADIEELVLHVQATVEEMTGVRLVPEVRIIGATETGERQPGMDLKPVPAPAEGQGRGKIEAAPR